MSQSIVFQETRQTLDDVVFRLCLFPVTIRAVVAAPPAPPRQRRPSTAQPPQRGSLELDLIKLP